MSVINVKTLLFISSADKTYSHCFLFHCAKYWADKGDKVLYISHEPVQNLPHSIGIPRDTQNLDNFSLIRFMYLPRWQDLLEHCYSIHLQPNPVSVIIVQELENYCSNGGNSEHDHVSLICGSLLHAASVCAAKNNKIVFLINGYNSNNAVIHRTISKNFFHNIWEIIVDTEDGENGICKKLVKLTNLSQVAKQNAAKLLVFSENSELSFLEFKSAFQTVISKCR